MLPTTALGVKRACLHCNSRFYDLAHQPPHCPKCGTEIKLTTGIYPARKRKLKERARDGGDMLIAHMSSLKAPSFNSKQEQLQEYQELDSSAEKEGEEDEGSEVADYEAHIISS
jgi:uncharacterized protein (TIGR02300 family)